MSKRYGVQLSSQKNRNPVICFDTAEMRFLFLMLLNYSDISATTNIKLFENIEEDKNNE